jgi:hypothetical protein
MCRGFRACALERSVGPVTRAQDARGDWLLQTVLGGAVLVPVGVLVLSSMGGVSEGLGSAIGGLLFACVLAFLAISAVSILGIPLRLIPRLYRWWRAHGWVAFALVAVGLVLIALAVRLASHGITFDEFGSPHDSYFPQPVLLAIGAFALSFGVVHVWPLRLGRKPVEPARPVTPS